MNNRNSVTFFGVGKLRIALILFSSGLIPSGGQISPRKDASFALELKLVWIESQIVFPCCVEDIKYALVMLCLTHTIDECVILITTYSHSSLPKTTSIFSCNTSPLQVRPNGSLVHLYFPKGVLKVQSASFLIQVNLPKPTTFVLDTEVG